MNTTENYGLKKPEKNEYISVDVINENTDAIDTELKKKIDVSGGDTAETIVSDFETSAESFPVPAAKEKAKTGWGKVKKFGEDFKAWMTGVCLLGHIVNNCVTNNPNLPLSAAQGKVLMDLYTVLNTKALKQDVSTTTNGQIIFTKSVGSGGSSFRQAPVLIQAPQHLSPGARAMIGFSNEGANSAIFWLDTDGRLKFTDNNNKTKTIRWLDE